MNCKYVATIGTIILFAGVLSCVAQEGQRNNRPVSAALLDAVENRIHNGDVAALSDLAATNSNKAIPLLMRFVAPQNKPGEPIPSSAGDALVKMHAENDIRALIVAYSKKGDYADRDRMLAFMTLGFMKSKASVRTIASFLDDDSNKATTASNLAGANRLYWR